jgi:hypothetical protein
MDRDLFRYYQDEEYYKSEKQDREKDREKEKEKKINEKINDNIIQLNDNPTKQQLRELRIQFFENSKKK